MNGLGRPKKTKKRKIGGESRFDLVPRLLEETKWFDRALGKILKDIAAGKRVELRSLHSILDAETGEKLELSLRLRISGPPDSTGWQDPAGWQIALIVDNRRIDGFDHENTFYDIRGNEQSGFHRHIWDADSYSAATDKVAVSFFDKYGITFEGFLIRAIKHMKIFLPKDDDNGNLLF